jgi:hypothetical protein
VVEGAEALVPANVPVSSVVQVGPPAAAIVARAGEGAHDLVVMGSRGLGFLGSFLLGSVSRAVAIRSSVPVLIARPRREKSRRIPGRRAHREAPAGPSHGVAVTMQAEPTTRGAPAAFLWLVAAPLLGLELILWIFDQMYAP